MDSCHVTAVGPWTTQIIFWVRPALPKAELSPRLFASVLELEKSSRGQPSWSRNQLSPAARRAQDKSQSYASLAEKPEIWRCMSQRRLGLAPLHVGGKEAWNACGYVGLGSRSTHKRSSPSS